MIKDRHFCPLANPAQGLSVMWLWRTGSSVLWLTLLKDCPWWGDQGQFCPLANHAQGQSVTWCGDEGQTVMSPDQPGPVAAREAVVRDRPMGDPARHRPLSTNLVSSDHRSGRFPGIWLWKHASRPQEIRPHSLQCSRSPSLPPSPPPPPSLSLFSHSPSLSSSPPLKMPPPPPFFFP